MFSLLDRQEQINEKKKPHIKKPLNAFMLYMKEMRAKVVAECTLKESAAINQILGRRVSISVSDTNSMQNFQIEIPIQIPLSKFQITHT